MKTCSIISKIRVPLQSPSQLVTDGKPRYGTFIEPIESINLLDTYKPCGKAMPNFMKKIRFTAWEAFEINFDELTLVSAVYSMGALKFTICTLFDKSCGKVSVWRKFMSSKKIKIAPNLINGSISQGTIPEGYLNIQNHFENGQCTAKCNMTNKKYGNIQYDIFAENLSPPSIVNIPLSKSHPLYTQKNIFKACGYVIFNGRKYCSNLNSLAIVDDHKGFYPFKAGYDWLTTMTTIQHHDKTIFLGFNLTKNQSVNQEDYNENVLWLEDESHALPPVEFSKIDKNTWTVKDDYGMVNLTYNYIDKYDMMVHLGVIDITYSLIFTNINGYIKDSNGDIYELDNISGIAEYRRQRI